VSGAAERLRDVAGVLDAAVGDDRDARPFGGGGRYGLEIAVSCGIPTPATCAWCRSSRADADLDRVDAGLEISAARRIGGLRRCGDELDLWEALAGLAHALDHAGRVTGAVSIQMTSQPAAISASMPPRDPDRHRPLRRTRNRPSSWCRERIFLGLLDIRIVIRTLEPTAAVDDEQLLDAVLVAGAPWPPRSATPSFTVTGFFVHQLADLQISASRTGRRVVRIRADACRRRRPAVRLIRAGADREASSSVRDGAIVNGSTTMPDCAFSRAAPRALSSNRQVLWDEADAAFTRHPNRGLRLVTCPSRSYDVSPCAAGSAA